MAKGNITKAQRTLYYNNVLPLNPVPKGEIYLDLFSDLSMVNRKLFAQGHVLGIDNIEFTFLNDVAHPFDTITLEVLTALDTWPVHNGWVKGNALWNEMNQLVLEDNPSIQGKWADFKVFLDTAHRAEYFLNGNARPRDSSGVEYFPGEWNYSDYVLPQHIVDPATGKPLLADQTQAHLIGPDVSVPGDPTQWASVGLVNAYQESRATVFANAPNVPPGMSQSFFNLLTDSGSQEPELADIIEGENNDPPYDIDEYPGGATNGANLPVVEIAAATIGSPIGMTQSFMAPCGLIKLVWTTSLDGVLTEVPPTINFKVSMMAGKYKGIAAIPMGQ